MPYQLMIAATLSFSLPSQLLSSPVPSGSIPVIKDKCPPAECPVKTMRSASMLYCLAFLHCPPQSATAVLNGRGRERNASHAVFDIDDIPAHFQIRQKEKRSASAVAEDPATAVVVDQSRNRRLLVLSLPHVELQRVVVRHSICDVRLDPVLLIDRGSPPGGVGEYGGLLLSKRRRRNTRHTAEE